MTSDKWLLTNSKQTFDFGFWLISIKIKHVHLIHCFLKHSLKSSDHVQTIIKTQSEMENILKRDPDLDHGEFEELRYDLNSSISEYESMEIEDDLKDTSSVSIENQPIKKEPNNESQNDNIDILNIKKEHVIDFSSEIILPQASQCQNVNPPKIKKEVKSKRELEEEEREKMQWVS